MLAAKIYEEIKGFSKEFWADVSSGAIIFSDLARRVLTKFDYQVPEDELELVNALVKCLRSGKYLLVIDNLESLLTKERQWKSEFYEDFFRVWTESGRGSKVLITTRERPKLKGFKWLPLKGLKKEEGAALLADLGVKGDLSTFSELVDGHPLLLKITADLIKDEYPQDPSLKRLEDLELENLHQLLTDPKVVGSHRREIVGIALVLEASFKRLKPIQKHLLLKASVYRSSFDREATAILLKPSFLVSWLKSILFQKRICKEEIEEQLRKLVERSWLEERLNKKRHYEFQPVVLEYIRSRAGKQNGSHWRAINYYYSIAKEEDWQNMEDLKEYLEIFYHLCQLGEYAEANKILIYFDEFLDLRGYYSTIIELNQQLIKNWKPRDNEEKENFSWVLTRLGNAYQSLSQFQEAIQYHQLSLYIDLELGNLEGLGTSLSNIGNAYECLDEYEKAIDYNQQALEIARKINNRAIEGNALSNLGGAYNCLNEYKKAIDYYQQALEIAREIGDRAMEGNALGGLGVAYNCLNKYKKAIDYHQQALEIARKIGNRSGEGNALGGLGGAYNCLNEYKKAIDYYQQALEIAREIGNHLGEGNALGGLGDAYNCLNEYKKAIDYYRQALAIAREVGTRAGEGEAWFNLGNVYSKLNQESEAVEAYQNSRQVYEAIGLNVKVRDCNKAIKDLNRY